MTKRWTLSESLNHFGVKAKNPRWSWSGRSDDGKTVVLTLWQDGITRRDGTLIYDTFAHKTLEKWEDLPGNRERIENLKWSRDHCDGRFRVIITVAKNKDAVPRRIAECFPQSKLIMRITALNDETGEFRAESVSS